MADIRKRIVFHGRVQGVGFRYTAKYLAQSLGLTGWVRNEWDGTVTLEIQGREMLINKLLVGLNHNQFITIDWMDTKEDRKSTRLNSSHWKQSRMPSSA